MVYLIIIKDVFYWQRVFCERLSFGLAAICIYQNIFIIKKSVETMTSRLIFQKNYSAVSSGKMVTNSFIIHLPVDVL